MNVAICDDNLKDIVIIEKYLDRISKSKIECDVFQSGEELILAYKRNKARYDVVFLDMEMCQLNGIETANYLREIDEYMIIIFVTIHTEYMRESFKCAPFRFLVKPVEFDEMQTVFNDIQKNSLKNVRCLLFRKIELR